jgi:hypothetical protein
MGNTVFSSEVDERILSEADAVLAANGLTVSEAFHRMLAYIAERKCLPALDLFTTNPEDRGGDGWHTDGYSNLNFKELLEACPLDGIELDRVKELPRDVDV